MRVRVGERKTKLGSRGSEKWKNMETFKNQQKKVQTLFG